MLVGGVEWNIGIETIYTMNENHNYTKEEVESHELFSILTYPVRS